jgi:hypothetical protein
MDPVDRMTPHDFMNPDGTPATTEQKAAAWRIVKDAQELKEQGGGAFQSLTQIYMTESTMVDLSINRFNEFAAALVKRFPKFTQWPADGQAGAMSLSWACGDGWHSLRGNLPPEFPNCSDALDRLDWTRASNECHLLENEPRSYMQRILFENAAVVAANDMDPNIFHYWPGKKALAPIESTRNA